MTGKPSRVLGRSGDLGLVCSSRECAAKGSSERVTYKRAEKIVTAKCIIIEPLLGLCTDDGCSRSRRVDVYGGVGSRNSFGPPVSRVSRDVQRRGRAENRPSSDRVLRQRVRSH